MCSFDTTPADVEALLADAAALASGAPHAPEGAVHPTRTR
jgi:hypothetical protein